MPQSARGGASPGPYPRPYPTSAQRAAELPHWLHRSRISRPGAAHSSPPSIRGVQPGCSFPRLRPLWPDRAQHFDPSDPKLPNASMRRPCGNRGENPGTRRASMRQGLANRGARQARSAMAAPGAFLGCYSRNAVQMLCVIGDSRYCRSVRSPLLMRISAGIPGTKVSPFKRSSAPSLTLTRTRK